MCASVSSINNADNNQPSTARYAKGVVIGAAVGAAPAAGRLYLDFVPLSDDALNQIERRIKKRNVEFVTFDDTMEIANKILDKTGLKEKGVKIVTEEPLKDKFIPKGDTLGKRYAEVRNYNRHRILGIGANANYNSCAKKISIGKKNWYNAVFHEIGHAMNYADGGFLNNLHKYFSRLRPSNIPLVGMACLAVGLLHNKNKEKPSKDKSLPEKTADFIHDFAGEITFLSLIPQLIEEGRASLKGAKLAKPYLTEAQHKSHVKILFKHSFCSYLKGAAATSFAVAIGIYVKDKIVHRKKN